MNTLSSLFNWIGNLVGANPNTLTTTSKTLVGALNEVDGDISTINGNITTINSDIATINNNLNYSGYGTQVSINSYTSSSNPYTVPSNGIVKLYCQYGSGNYIGITVANSDLINQVVFQIVSVSAGHMILPVPVFKGQKVWVSNSNGSVSAEFIPFTTA